MVFIQTQGSYSRSDSATPGACTAFGSNAQHGTPAQPIGAVAYPAVEPSGLTHEQRQQLLDLGKGASPSENISYPAVERPASQGQQQLGPSCVLDASAPTLAAAGPSHPLAPLDANATASNGHSVTSSGVGVTSGTSSVGNAGSGASGRGRRSLFRRRVRWRAEQEQQMPQVPEGGGGQLQAEEVGVQAQLMRPGAINGAGGPTQGCAYSTPRAGNVADGYPVFPGYPQPGASIPGSGGLHGGGGMPWTSGNASSGGSSVIQHGAQLGTQWAHWSTTPNTGLPQAVGNSAGGGSVLRPYASPPADACKAGPEGSKYPPVPCRPAQPAARRPCTAQLVWTGSAGGHPGPSGDVLLAQRRKRRGAAAAKGVLLGGVAAVLCCFGLPILL